MCENPIYCEQCGDCVVCFGEDPCHFSTDGEHSVAIQKLPEVTSGEMEHVLDESCWCDPEIESMNDGSKIIVHRGTN